MKSDLQLLIEEFQREYDLLEFEMNKCIKDQDFLGAERFKKSFIYTKDKLRILKNLENPNRYKINSLKQRIEYLKKQLRKKEHSEFLLSVINRDLAKSENELLKLEATKLPLFYDKDELLACLEKMNKGELKKVELEIEEGYFIIEILKIDNDITLNLKAEKIRHWTSNQGMSEMKKMGFSIAEEEANLKIDNFDKTKISFIMEILSRLVYDVLGLFKDRNKKVIIKY